MPPVAYVEKVPPKREGEEYAKINRRPALLHPVARVRNKRACSSRFARNFLAASLSFLDGRCTATQIMCATIRMIEGVSVSVTTVWHEPHSWWWPQKTGRRPAAATASATGRKWHFHYESHSRSASWHTANGHDSAGVFAIILIPQIPPTFRAPRRLEECS